LHRLAASVSTCLRSCSVAGVTRRAKRCPRVSVHRRVDLRALSCAWRRRNRHGGRSGGGAQGAAVEHCGGRPWARRSTALRSWTIASKTPAP
jgi:hypothetical protein